MAASDNQAQDRAFVQGGLTDDINYVGYLQNYIVLKPCN